MPKHRRSPRTPSGASRRRPNRPYLRTRVLGRARTSDSWVIGVMARLRRIDCSGPGIARRRRGRGFEFLDEDGNRVEDPEATERIAELAIPPAWREVWVCTDPMGYIQATGID